MFQQGVYGHKDSLACMRVQSLQSYLTPCNPMDCSPPGSSIYGILQGRILEWVAMPSSRGSFQTGDWTYMCLHLLKCRLILYPPRHLGTLTLALPILFFFFFFGSEFCHTLKWKGLRFTCLPHPDPPSHLPPYPLPPGPPRAPGPSACLMHPTWAGDLFHPW